METNNFEFSNLWITERLSIWIIGAIVVVADDGSIGIFSPIAPVFSPTIDRVEVLRSHLKLVIKFISCLC